MQYTVILEHSTRRHTAVVRRRASLADLSTVVPESCGIVWETLREQKINGVGRQLALYLDKEINLEVGVELGAPIPIQGVVIGSVIPAGPVASTVHYGPYSQLSDAHDAIRDWCRENGYSLAGPNWEIYDHWRDDWDSNPAKIRTEVYYLLETAG